MKRLTAYFFLVAIISLFSGCAYNVQPEVSAATNVYSSYNGKVPGRYVVVIDGSMNDMHRTVKPSSYVCSADSYPVDTSNVFAASIMGTLNQVFQSTVEENDMPSAEDLKRLDALGTVFVRLDDFSPRLSCSMGFWSGSCTAHTDLSFGVEVRNPKGMLYATSVEADKTASGDAGQACGGAANILARSIKKATRDAMNRMAERLANAERIRSVSNAATQ